MRGQLTTSPLEMTAGASFELRKFPQARGPHDAHFLHPVIVPKSLSSCIVAFRVFASRRSRTNEIGGPVARMTSHPEMPMSLVCALAILVGSSLVSTAIGVALAPRKT